MARYEITATGLIAHGGWTPELWEAAGLEIARYQKGLMWLIGDWLNAGDREGYVERGKLAEACERFGIACGTAKNAAMVAAAFDERSLRRDLLEFGHHQAVANHDQAGELLAWAEASGATVKQLREEKQRRSVAAAPTAAEASGTIGSQSSAAQRMDACRGLITLRWGNHRSRTCRGWLPTATQTVAVSLRSTSTQRCATQAMLSAA